METSTIDAPRPSAPSATPHGKACKLTTLAAAGVLWVLTLGSPSDASAQASRDICPREQAGIREEKDGDNSTITHICGNELETPYRFSGRLVVLLTPGAWDQHAIIIPLDADVPPACVFISVQGFLACATLAELSGSTLQIIGVGWIRVSEVLKNLGTAEEDDNPWQRTDHDDRVKDDWMAI